LIISQQYIRRTRLKIVRATFAHPLSRVINVVIVVPVGTIE